MPAGVAGEGWTPSWQRDSDPDAGLQGDALEPADAETDSTELVADAAEGDCGAIALDGEVADEKDDNDTRATEELQVTPLLAEALQALSDDEKTQPRIRIDDAGGLPADASQRDSDLELDVRTEPKIKVAGLDTSGVFADEFRHGPAVVIAAPRIIRDSPAETSSLPVGVVVSEAQAVAVQSAAFHTADAELDDAGLQLEDVEEAEPDRGPSRVPPPPPPPSAARGDGGLPSAAIRAEGTSLPAPQRNEPAQVGRAKPPPPTARVEPVAKRPPPPPGAAKLDEDRQKRKQVRQWWERFFSDDYLMTVLPPSAAQIARQVDFIEASLGLNKGATILDVGCGLGLHSIELSRRGYLVVGLDLSLAMITRAAEAAQEHSLKINFVHADIREMEFDGAFDAVVSMGTTFGFFDEEANRDVLVRLLHALRPGGRLLLDVVNRDYVAGLQPNLVWFEGDDCVCMEESDFNYFNSRLNVKRTMMREDGRQSNAEYSLRLYSLHELGQLMQQLGLRVIEVSGQEAIRGAFFGSHSPRILMLAERRLPARSSTAIPPERGSAEHGRTSLPFPPERSSADVVKPPRPE